MDIVKVPFNNYSFTKIARILTLTNEAKVDISLLSYHDLVDVFCKLLQRRPFINRYEKKKRLFSMLLGPFLSIFIFDNTITTYMKHLPPFRPQ